MTLGKISDKSCNLQKSTNYLNYICSEFYCFYKIVGFGSKNLRWLCQIFEKFAANSI